MNQNTPGVVSRAEYESHLLQELRESGMSEAEALGLLDRRYPLETRAVREELTARGLNATEHRVESWARTADLRIVAGARLWYRDDIDRLADHLAEMGKLSHRGLYRAELGLTLADELQFRKQAEDRAHGAAAEKLGLTLDELYRLARESQPPMPWPSAAQWTDRDIAAAKAWLEQHG